MVNVVNNHIICISFGFFWAHQCHLPIHHDEACKGLAIGDPKKMTSPHKEVEGDSDSDEMLEDEESSGEEIIT